MKNTLIIILSALGILFLGIHLAVSGAQKEVSIIADTEVDPQNLREAVFAGGCFWCTESDFEKIDGVVDAVSGYTGGNLENPTYRQVSAGGTGHIEAVRVIYDSAKIDYGRLLQIFWRSVNPTDGGGQFVDRGAQYRSAIFYTDDQQKEQAQASKLKLADSGMFKDDIATDILPLGTFYEAEDYHQNYYKKNPLRYKFYRANSGRDQYLKRTWADKPLQKPDAVSMTRGGAFKKPTDTELRKQLTPLQYRVTQKEGTEPPFQNDYWDHHGDGIYVDIVSGEPLFSSTDKFESGTGWPSFTRPLEPANVVQHKDRTLFMERIEVRSKNADSHLGHVFPDGPKPTGLRYCINSAALRFVSLGDMEKEGYGQYKSLFNTISMNDRTGDSS